MPEPDDFATADLDELLTDLRAVGFRGVDLDPTKALPGGAWVRIDGLQPDTLAGLVVEVTVHLLVPERDHGRTLDALAVAYNTAKPVLREFGPLGVATLTGVVLPGSQTPIPALAVPVTINTTQE